MTRMTIEQIARKTEIPLEDARNIFRAFIGEYRTYRTMGGIIRESGVSEEDIRKLIDDGYIIECEEKIGGASVYTYNSRLLEN